MAFKIEINPQNDATGGRDRWSASPSTTTRPSFESKEATKRCAETERARLMADEQAAKSGLPS
jgi:hypothetical protein